MLVLIWFGLYLTSIATIVAASVYLSLGAMLVSVVAYVVSAVIVCSESASERDAIISLWSSAAGYCMTLLFCVLAY